MKLEFLTNNTFIVYLNTSFIKLNKDNLEEKLKDILIRIRKKYFYEIYGFYDVNIYPYGNLLNVIKFVKKDEDEYFKKTIDLKIIYHKDNNKIMVSDLLLLNKMYMIEDNNIYMNTGDLNQKDIYKICEYYSIYNK